VRYLYQEDKTGTEMYKSWAFFGSDA